MGRKAKYTKGQKIQACEDYLSGKKSASQIATELNMSKHGHKLFLKWGNQYHVNGHTIFDTKNTNKKYTKEFKEMVVQEYLQGHGSYGVLAVKYGIPQDSTVLNWVNKYNSHRELKDYDPKPEVYMTNTLKVSKEKKIEIIKYCIDHDYKGTTELYGGNYALEDRRGKRKSEEQLTDLEKAQLERIYIIRKQKIKDYTLIQSLHENCKWAPS